MSVLLGVDLGERRIGLARGDLRSGAVRPLATLHRDTPDRDAAALRRVAAEQGITEMVIGLPLAADGGTTRQAALTRAWADAVVPLVGLPASWRDERHTSQVAERRTGGPGRGRSGGPPSPAALRAHRARLDREAAAAIVQAEMDARTGARP